MKNINQVVYSGIVLDVPRFSHKSGEKAFYEVRIASERLNKNKKDVLPVVIKSELLDKLNIIPGMIVKVTGE